MRKSERHKMILELIGANDIGNQETLRGLLSENGTEVTQATLSRDMRELGIKKITDENGVTKYSAEKDGLPELPAFVRESVLSVDSAGNTVVFKCGAGSAQAVCAVIDRENGFGAVGTIAGDDTIFMLMRTEQEAKNLAYKLNKSLI